MELKKRFSPKWVFVGLYVLAFLVYIIYGLQPVEAAEGATIDGELSIPSIELVSDVTRLDLEDGELKTPDTIVGSFARSENKTLLIGHSTTVFVRLNQVRLGDEIEYNGKKYKVTRLSMLDKNIVDMGEVLRSAERDTLVLMTCAGEKSSYRLVITAFSI